MSLTHLQIQNVRNLAVATLDFAAGVNFVVGPNGSGKSSLLEAISILSRGRSFRTHQLRHVVTRGKEVLAVFGRVCPHEKSSDDIPIGFEYSTKIGTRAKIGFEPVRRVSELAGVLPVHYIGPEFLGLFAGSPQERRVFLDWGLFHVEHVYLGAYQRYARALKQRNAAIRLGGGPTQRSLAAAWDADLIETSDVLTTFRREYLSVLADTLSTLIPHMLNMAISSVELRFNQGWNAEAGTLKEALARNWERDLAAGSTQVGPHRADYRLYINGEAAKYCLSAGQMKVALCAFAFAQIGYAATRRNKKITLLIDDLPAELDEHHRGIVIDGLANLSCQIIATSTEKLLVCLDRLGAPDKMFHVEHGVIAATD